MKQYVVTVNGITAIIIAAHSIDAIFIHAENLGVTPCRASSRPFKPGKS